MNTGLGAEVCPHSCFAAYRPCATLTASWLTAASLAALLVFVPCAAHAEIYIAATGGYGPDGYQSRQVRANADLFDTPISVGLLRFESGSSSDSISQSGLSLDWKVSGFATVGVDHDRQDNGLVDISGNALRVALNLDTLWNGNLTTRLDLKRAVSAYQFNSLPAAVQNDTVEQTANSIALSQDIAASLSVYAAHDRYSYDTDPTHAAVLLMRIAPRRFFSTSSTLLTFRNNTSIFITSSTLLTFPNSTSIFGVAWHPAVALTMDFSSSKTPTQLEQEQRINRLALDYQVSDHLNLSAAVSRVTTTAVVTRQTYFAALPLLTIPAGTTVIPASSDTYSELGASWIF